MVFQDFRVTRVNQVLQGARDLQELMVQEDLKDTKGNLQVSLAYLVQRVSQVAPDIQDSWEHLESRACLVLKVLEDHPEGQDLLASLDQQDVQVIQGGLGCRDPQEKWGILDQEASWGTQGHQVFQE